MKLFLAHIFLVGVIVLGMGYRQYINGMEFSEQQIIKLTKMSSTGLVNDFSLSMSGRNYGNVQLPKFVGQLVSSGKLFYLEAKGLSDQNSYPFHVTYSKDAQMVWRAFYEEGYRENIENKLIKLKKLLAEADDQNIKLNFLINRSKEAIAQYDRNSELIASNGQKYQYLKEYGSEYLDRENLLVSIILPTENPGGGELWLICDASELKTMETTILSGVWKEMVIALLTALVLLLLAASWITKPIMELVNYIIATNEGFSTKQVPGLQRKDEIGVLSRAFEKLFERLQLHTKKLENLSLIDPLTGLYNRRKFDQVVNREIKRCQRNKTCLALIYLDVDHFKDYNDTYGHNKGDDVLRLISLVISDAVPRETDYVFRFGGEEFAVLASINAPSEVDLIAERIRLKVLQTEIEHKKSVASSMLTISAGVCCCDFSILAKNVSTRDILEVADKALYEAKASGRNQIICRNLQDPVTSQVKS